MRAGQALEQLAFVGLPDRDRIHFACNQGRGAVGNRDIDILDIFFGHAIRGQGFVQQELFDCAQLGGDFFTLQVFDGIEPCLGDHGIVARRVVVDQDRFERLSLRERSHGIVPCLAVRIHFPCRQRAQRVGVVGEPDQFDIDIVLFEKPLLLRNVPAGPARPVRVADRDRIACISGRGGPRGSGCRAGSGGLLLPAACQQEWEKGQRAKQRQAQAGRNTHSVSLLFK